MDHASYTAHQPAAPLPGPVPPPSATIPLTPPSADGTRSPAPDERQVFIALTADRARALAASSSRDQASWWDRLLGR